MSAAPIRSSLDTMPWTPTQGGRPWPPVLRKAGEFCWINMLTPRPAEAMEFFAAVLGWTYFEMPGIGHGIQVGGRDIGGLFDLARPEHAAGPAAAVSASW